MKVEKHVSGCASLRPLQTAQCGDRCEHLSIGEKTSGRGELWLHAGLVPGCLVYLANYRGNYPGPLSFLIGDSKTILYTHGLMWILNKIISISQFQAQGNHSVNVVNFITMILIFFNPHLRIGSLIFRGGGIGMWERNTDWWPPVCTPTGDGTCNLGMCPDLGRRLQPFDVWDNTSTNWAKVITMVPIAIIYFYGDQKGAIFIVGSLPSSSHAATF